jgi:hypothetical protein
VLCFTAPMTRLSLLAVSLVALAGCGGPDSVAATSPTGRPRTCTQVGCHSLFDASFNLPISLDALRQGSLVVCRNGQCLSGSFASLSPQDSGGVTSVTFPDDQETQTTQSAQVRAAVQNESTDRLSIEITYLPWDRYDLSNGDTYAIEVLDAAQQPLRSTQTTVAAYDDFYPNGAECGPPCHVFRADLRAIASPANGGHD